MNVGSALRLGCALALFCAMTLAAVPATADAQADGMLVQLPGSDACIEDRYAASTTLCLSRGDGLDNPGAAAVSPDGHHLYTTSIYGDAGAAFSLDATTGAVRQLAGHAACIEDLRAPAATVCPVATSGLNGAIGVTVSPDGRHVYVSSIDSSAVVIFKRDAQTGALSQTPGAECVRDSKGCSRRARAPRRGSPAPWPLLSAPWPPCVRRGRLLHRCGRVLARSPFGVADSAAGRRRLLPGHAHGTVDPLRGHRYRAGQPPRSDHHAGWTPRLCGITSVGRRDRLRAQLYDRRA